MVGAPLLVALALIGGATDLKNPALVEGIRLYDALDYTGALQSLTQALDRPSSKREFAKIHLYIGLIQHRYKLKDDAEASFTKALDYDPKLKLPKNATTGARTLFQKIQKAKLGKVPDEDAPEPRADTDKKKKKQPKIAKRREDDEDGNSGIEYIASSKVETSTQARAGNGQKETRAMPNDALAMADPVSSSGTKTDGVPGLAPKTAAPGDAATSGVATAPAVEQGSSGAVVGWIAVGVGVAAVAAGVTLAVLSSQNGAAIDGEMGASRAQDLYNTAVKQRTFSIISFGVGGASLGLAAVMFLSE